MRRGKRVWGEKPIPIVSRTEANVKLTESNLPKEVVGKKAFGVQWSGFLTPTESGDFILGIRCEGFGTPPVGNKLVATAFGGSGGLSSGVGRVHLEKGQ